MSDTCPYCKQPMPEPMPMVEQLKRWCKKNGHAIYPGGRVSPETAAKILNCSIGTLKNWRYLAEPLPFIRTGSGRGKISYRLQDLANHLEKEKCTGGNGR